MNTTFRKLEPQTRIRAAKESRPRHVRAVVRENTNWWRKFPTRFHLEGIPSLPNEETLAPNKEPRRAILISEAAEETNSRTLSLAGSCFGSSATRVRHPVPIKISRAFPPVFAPIRLCSFLRISEKFGSLASSLTPPGGVRHLYLRDTQSAPTNSAWNAGVLLLVCMLVSRAPRDEHTKPENKVSSYRAQPSPVFAAVFWPFGF